MRRKREETTRNYVSREKRSLMEENIRPIFFRPTVYVYTQLSGGSGVFDFFAFRSLRTEETGKKTLQNRRDNNRIRFWKNFSDFLSKFRDRLVSLAVFDTIVSSPFDRAPQCLLF